MSGQSQQISKRKNYIGIKEGRGERGRNDHQVLGLDNCMVADKPFSAVLMRMHRIGNGEGLGSNEFLFGT